MLPSIALVIFLAVACVGLYMATRMVRNQDVAVQIVHSHGLAAAVGIGVLLYAVTQNQIEDRGAFALVLFLVTAAGGVVLHRLAKKLSNKPKGLAMAHGGFAIFAIAMLATYLM
jgi:hypothetical protein